MSSFYVVSTPIGNLEDLSFRALRILKEVDLILCEDTRVTKKLLSRYGINTETLSYHQHSNLQKVEYIIDLLRQGKSLALVSDAGAPGISDPGGKIVAEIIRTEAASVITIPGPSALIAAASIAGLSMDKFLFLGFPPTKRKRKKFFQEVIDSKYPVIFYESSHRILKTLQELKEIDTGVGMVVCRELTKQFESVYRGKIGEVLDQLTKGEIRGEFVVIADSK
ncbi:MAG: 16S rRNA (cytidine(1402)-2'-O)-methyltransferase [Candidatus Wildermuthbacteria bacterium RIFCSPLOWO2_12_FULL_40_9]|uniref:Ribosomal RNA small subunit methyltransferase I n=2 Tax=Candidatus Wildermuthiibacteriota TaxID=1817923 RepID=A0A1G2RD79_9BACT|nr:MAG: 16S rRNA (cytidine(1402)-2'-O)-methyltransferase [Candidatus Wildermuthbacteria bacterium RIFCSPHIGHO2_12_FULL_40_12]OHA76922.1 MAG: 16S rRNA (cytidine(1402)-2'-O)-methyltransferase [Candidatus Wildermuthbacteria bacterium RIFCSPLOWO2_12_FULL_40_9]